MSWVDGRVERLRDNVEAHHMPVDLRGRAGAHTTDDPPDSDRDHGVSQTCRFSPTHRLPPLQYLHKHPSCDKEVGGWVG